MKRRILAVILSAVIIMCLLPISVSARPNDFVLDITDDEGDFANIVGYVGHAESLVIPNIIKGHYIVEIAERAFEGCYTLEEVTICGSEENSIYINDYAFADCVNLKRFETSQYDFLDGAHIFEGCPEDLTIYSEYHAAAIDYAMYYGLNYEFTNSLSRYFEYTVKDDDTLRIDRVTEFPYHLMIPGEIDGQRVSEIGPNVIENLTVVDTYFEICEGIEIIDDGAFYNCANLNTIILPSTLRSFTGNAFVDCKKITELVISESNPYYTVDASGIVYTKDMKTIVFVPKGGAMNSFTVPDDVNAIEDYAFPYSNILLHIYIPSSVIFIGENAFANRKVRFYCEPDSYAADYATQKGYEVYYNDYYNNQLYEYKIKSDNTAEITAINLTEMTDLVIPQTLGGHSVTSIAKLPDVSKIKSLVIPEGVTTLAESCFRNAPIKNLNLPSTIKTISKNAFCKTEIETLVVPEGVVQLGSSAFEGCSKLKNVQLPDSLTTIGTRCFCDCSALESINLPDNLKNITSYAFKNCNSLTSIIFPGNIKLYGIHCFDGCSSLKTVVFQSGETSIPSAAFYNCTALESVVLPDTVQSIKANAFFGCSSLKEIVIPEGATTIANSAFYGCFSLKTVSLPQSLTYIGEATFANTAIKEITIYKNIVTIADNAFANCDGLIVYGYLDSEAEKYAEREGFTFIYLDIITPGDTDGDGQITLSDYSSVKNMLSGDEAFTNLQTVSADLNGDGTVDAFDLFEINKFISVQ